MTPTPEERAQAIKSDLIYQCWPEDYPLVEVIAAAITEAVEGEREACAEIAEYWDWRGSGDCTNDDIAAAIRARKGEDYVAHT